MLSVYTLATQRVDMHHTESVPETKIRTVRIDDELWEAAQEVARRRRESVADAIRRGLLEYVKGNGGTVGRDA